MTPERLAELEAIAERGALTPTGYEVLRTAIPELIAALREECERHSHIRKMFNGLLTDSYGQTSRALELLDGAQARVEVLQADADRFEEEMKYRTKSQQFYKARVKALQAAGEKLSEHLLCWCTECKELQAEWDRAVKGE